MKEDKDREMGEGVGHPSALGGGGGLRGIRGSSCQEIVVAVSDSCFFNPT